MNSAIQEEVVSNGMGRRMTVGWVKHMLGVVSHGKKRGQVFVNPQWDHEQEGHTRRVEEQVDLVKLVRRSLRGAGRHNLLEENVGRHKDQRRTKCTEQPNSV